MHKRTTPFAPRLGLATVLALGVMAASPAVAQTLPAPPTHAQGVAADTRTGSYFSVGGTRIFFQSTGSGTPLLLIHGYPLSGALFQYQQTGLAAHFNVITLDLPGFGRSGAPAGFGSTALYAHYVLALMDHLGIDKAVIGGHSMGGLITQELYREAPQRFAGMILIDTVAMGASQIEQGEWTGYAFQATTGGVSSIINTVTPQLLVGPTRTDAPAATTTLEDIIAEASVQGAQAGAETLAIRPDYTAQLASIAVPTLVIEGVYDPVYGLEVAKALSQQIPNATLALLPNGSHAAIYERPNEANAAILGWARANRLGS